MGEQTTESGVTQFWGAWVTDEGGDQWWGVWAIMDDFASLHPVENHLVISHDIEVIKVVVDEYASLQDYSCEAKPYPLPLPKDDTPNA